ncbi:MAG: methyl-accepting chemotaxis protein, partial [Comamonas sp.]|nr:methyl-accepting chemotaxis protein [Comamonas sp.]
AARAGEQGRGFAVVAGEVRALAGRSAEAAKEIKILIDNSVQRVDEGSALVHQAGQTMQEVVQSIRRVTDIMGEISAASSEQSAGVNQVGEAVMQMDQVTQQNAALVEEMAAAASGLQNQAQHLLQAVSVFQLAQTYQSSASQPPLRPSNIRTSTNASASVNTGTAPKKAANGHHSHAPAQKAASVAAPRPTTTQPAKATPHSAPRLVAPASNASTSSQSHDDWETF